MKVYIDGGEKVKITHGGGFQEGQSTAFLIAIVPKGTIYTYIIPYATDEDDALDRFKQSVENLIDFAKVTTHPDDMGEVTFETWPDAFDVDFRQKVEESKTRMRELGTHVARLEHRWTDAVDNENDTEVLLAKESWDLAVSQLTDEKQKYRKLVTTPLSLCTTTVAEERVVKQREVLKAIENGDILVQRLESDRTYPTGYWDDSRGELRYVHERKDFIPAVIPNYVVRYEVQDAG